ncbi:NAD-dependent glyceraldehyde-3-phosphate dehydrogenase for arsenate detoxification [hydrothermal vent metagenome]|uniref:NAD-dependent glyceraldehyde-3-phosphate dehydrogenase for arsenate detoxification n=1 Tax=hydrothermal vent metagenome TaxID=652676 RepID=A0A3B0Y1N2_9ZZZZ
MAIRTAINGFGRMGRLALRVAWGCDELEFVHINETAADAACSAHLLNFDSVHGKWDCEASADVDHILINEQRISHSSLASPTDVDWQGMGVDLVIEASGKFRTPELLQTYFDQGVRKVVVAAPVAEKALNIVMGVNDHLYDPVRHHIVTAASCTTNCLAPVIKVMHESLGIRHGCMTTIHNITNTQTIVDKGHKDLRRARACGESLIPTSTGSAKAITQIFPELNGKLNGLAVRVPLLNASLTDLVFESNRKTSAVEVNDLFRQAAEGSLAGILGYEERPLVSVDYRDDIRSSIVDALSTLVIDDTQVKVLAWYDNEVGYANRLAELARKVARSL